jgi:hypothetical protein
MGKPTHAEPKNVMVPFVDMTINFSHFWHLPMNLVATIAFINITDTST